MQVIPFWECQRLAGKTSQALTEGIEPTFNMIGLAFIFANHAMELRIKDVSIGLPTITEGGAADILAGNAPVSLRSPIQ